MIRIVSSSATGKTANSSTELACDAIVQAAVALPVMFGCEIVSFRTHTLLRLGAFGGHIPYRRVWCDGILDLFVNETSHE